TNSVTAPAVVIRPIAFPVGSVNQSAPSGPATMSDGCEKRVGTTNSVMRPFGVLRAIWLTLMSDSANQRFPSGPRVICRGGLLAVGALNGRKTPAWARAPAPIARHTTSVERALFMFGFLSRSIDLGDERPPRKKERTARAFRIEVSESARPTRRRVEA